jgi:hypothetical protein
MTAEPITTIDETLVDQIAAALNEPNLPLLRQVIAVIGPDRANEFLQQTLAIEASGGQLIQSGKRRRTPGGVFFYLVRTSLSGNERREIWPNPPSAAPRSPAPSLTPPTWEEAKQLIAQAIKQIGEAKTVKLTLVGRPGKVVEQESCVVLSMKGKEPPSLPKGLPSPPTSGAITWVVFVAKKQWSRVKESIATNQDDQLIIEGWPGVDPKRGMAIVLATNCRSVQQEKAQRGAPTSSAHE